MKFNDQFKMNQMVCCARGTDGPHDGVGGGVSIDGSPSGLGGPDSNSDGGSGAKERHQAIMAVNNPKDYKMAKSLVDKAEDLANKLNISYTKAAGMIGLGLATAGPVGAALAGLKAFRDLPKEKQKMVEEAAQSLVDEFGLDPARTNDIATYYENYLNRKKASNFTFRGTSEGREAEDILAALENPESNTSGQSSTMPEQTTYDNGMPGNIPDQFIPGLEDFVNSSNSANDRYQAFADELWTDYLEFEDTFFDKLEGNVTEYNQNLASMPSMNIQLPSTMGGSTMPLAPKVHSAMYTDQFNAKNSATANQANTQLAGMGSRDALAKNMFQANLSNLQNTFMPTQVGLDLYNLERSGELGIQQAQAGKYEPSTVSTWAPIVGSILKTDTADKILDSVWKNIFG